VQVVGQNRELDESHAESIGPSHKRFPYGRVLTPIPQVLQTVPDAQRDVRRMARLERRALRMRNARTFPCTLATGASARTTPRLELETLLMRYSHDPSYVYDEREEAKRAAKCAFFASTRKPTEHPLHLNAQTSAPVSAHQR
jgi:hypothetical protein